MGHSDNGGEPTNGVALNFFREQFDKRPDDEGLKANAREAFLLTFRRFGTTNEEAANRLGDAFLQTAEATSAQRVMVRDGLDEAWSMYRGAPTKTAIRRGLPLNPLGRVKRGSRLAALGPYAPVPRAIAKDPKLSLAAKGLAFMLADQINLGPWNTDLHVVVSYPELVKRTGVSLSNLKRLAVELRLAGYLETESLNRGGVRCRFTSSPVDST